MIYGPGTHRVTLATAPWVTTPDPPSTAKHGYVVPVGMTSRKVLLRKRGKS